MAISTDADCPVLSVTHRSNRYQPDGWLAGIGQLNSPVIGSICASAGTGWKPSTSE